MDLTSLAVSESSKLTIKHPRTGDDTDIVIELYGKDSDAYKKAYSKMVKSVIQRTESNTELNEAYLDAEMYTACTKAWVNVDLDGKTLKCTPKNVRLVYSDKRLRWMHEQVVTFIGERENFMQPN
tara:strand:- start:150 stop:524 length:375 start_codon:yes stop_codon:yes gene_type:complete